MQTAAEAYTGGITKELYLVFATSFIFFGITYYVSRQVITMSPKVFPTFASLSKENKRDYLSRVVSTIHALLSCLASVISTCYLCCFNDMECMKRPQLFRS